MKNTKRDIYMSNGTFVQQIYKAATGGINGFHCRHLEAKVHQDLCTNMEFPLSNVVRFRVSSRIHLVLR